MIPRRPPPAAHVAAALGLAATDVIDVEPRPVPGARTSLTHAYRAARPGPRRPSRVVVLPYDDPAWTAAARDAFALEVVCFRALWRWVREDLGRDVHGVWRVAPLVEPVDEAVRAFDVDDEGRLLPALARPWLDWPDLGEAGLSDDRGRALWAKTREALEGPIARATGLAFDLPDDPLQRVDLRRRLLTDGHTLIPSSFRPFLAASRPLDDARPRG